MRTYLKIPACAALRLGFWPAGTYAQQSVSPVDEVQVRNVNPSSSDQSQEPQLKINPLKALERSEPDAGEPYHLGAGDTIKLYVAGQAELTRDYIIGPDGRVTIDVAGSVKVSDLTREQAAKAISDALATYYTLPAVTVGVAKYGSNTIMIFGNVLKPGILDYEGTTPTLLDAIGRAGMLVNPYSNDGLPESCVIYRGSNTVLPVPLHELLYAQGSSADVRLQRGDKIFIPVDRKHFVSVLGQVGKPGPVTIIPGLDLKLALAEAGGLKDEAGLNPTIHIFQASTNRELSIRYKRLMTQAASEIPLGPGDVISIPMSGFNHVGYVLTKISPALTMISLAALVAQ